MDLGSDFAGILDIDAALTVVSGWRNLGHALARRLTTANGSLFYAPDYGYDLRSLLNAAVRDTTRIAQRIIQEMLKDKRVESATANVVFDGNTLTAHVGITPKGDDNPSFSLVMNVSQLTVDTLFQLGLPEAA
jgi:phage baseplate assembly protein W